MAPARSAAPAPEDFLRLHTETRGFMLGRPQHATPTPDGKSVLFLRSGPRDPVMSLFEFEVATGTTRELVAPAQLLRGAEEQLSAEERARRERMRVSTRGFTGFALARDGEKLLLQLSGRLYVMDRRDGKVAELPTGATAVIDPRLSPDGQRVAYVRDRDLYVMHLGTHVETRLTRTSDRNHSAGLAEFVAQEEMDRFSGYFWAPDSRHIAWEAVDNSAVEEFHLADPAHPERPPTLFRYPRAGRDNARVALFVTALPGDGARPAAARAVTWDGEAFPYLSQVSWRRGGPLTLVVRSRAQTEVRVIAWSEAGGSRVLLEEHDPAWLNIDRTLPRWLPDGSGFLWSSDVGGDNRLQLRAPDGYLMATLSPAGVQYLGVRHLEAAAVWFAASAEPTEQHLYRASLDGSGPAVALSSEAGVHELEATDDSPLVVVRTTTPTAMPRSRVLRGGQPIGDLPSVALEPPASPPVEMATVGAHALRAVVVRPRTFDARRRYPVVVDVYGGPHHLSVQAALPPMLLRQYIADQGYIVVAIDNRGTPGRGRAFERALKESTGQGSFAAVPLDDQVEALQALGRDRPEMDLARVGIYGWSFGGYLSALAVLRRPDVFQVAVAGAPVVDWADYDTCYTERYLGLPADNPAGYQQSSLLPLAARLTRPLLLIHGTTDDNVYFLHSLKLADALFRAGRDFELLPLQGFTHMVPDAAVRERLYARILMTLARALRP